MKKILFLSLLVLWGFDLKAQVAQEILQQKVDSVREASGIPAMAIAVISSHDKTIAISGDHKNQNGTPVHTEHLFHLGSNTKAFTATIAMQMAERGEINLHRNIFEYIPHQEEYHEGFKDLTIAKLLSHKGGIPAFTSGLEFTKLSKWKGEGGRDRESFVHELLQMEPKPEITYSNAGYALAAYILETVSGQPFEMMLDEFMQANGWNYALGWPNKKDEKNPWGHMNTAMGLLAQGPASQYKLEPFIMPAGDMSMNILDYSEFVKANLKGLKGTDSFLRSGSFDQLHFGSPGYSYGWGNSTMDEVGRISFHDGSAGTYYTHTIIFSDMDYAFVGLINSGNPKHAETLMELRKYLYRQIKDNQLTQK